MLVANDLFNKEATGGGSTDASGGRGGFLDAQGLLFGQFNGQRLSLLSDDYGNNALTFNILVSGGGGGEESGNQWVNVFLPTAYAAPRGYGSSRVGGMIQLVICNVGSLAPTATSHP